MRKIILKTILFKIFTSISFLLSQIPIELNHPTNVIAKRFAANGEIDLKYFNSNNLSVIELNDIFSKSDDKIIKRSIWDLNIPYKDSTTSTIQVKDTPLSFFKILKNNDLTSKKRHFLKIDLDSALFWINLREKILFQPTENYEQYLFLDQFTLNGIIMENIYVNSSFSMFRHTGNKIWISGNYKGEWIKYFNAINTTIWYNNHTSIYYRGKTFDFEMANNPFSWGWSSGNSPLISSNSVPFNRFSIYKKSEKFSFEYFHGSLTSEPIDDIHISNEKLEKFIAGHRLQLRVTKKLIISLSELVVYGKRSPELSYLNPISFFWAQEHNLGDLDNILLAIDFGYRPFTGLILYNTLVIDELSWENLFSEWWGNKYSFQSGFFLSSKNMQMPDFRFEYTATRPWTFTHPDFPYTNRGEIIGTSNGPSSISLRIESFYFISSDVMLQLSFENIQKGIGMGSNINDNYDDRNKANDSKTKLLLDHSYKENKMELILQYHINNNLKLISQLNANQLNNPLSYGYDGQSKIDKELILGFDLKW